MNRDNPYMMKLRNGAMKMVIDDLVEEKLAGLLGKSVRDAYKDKLSYLEVMGISIKRNTLMQRVTREYRKRIRQPTEEGIINLSAPGSGIPSPPSPPDVPRREEEENNNDDNDEPPPLRHRDWDSDSDDDWSDDEPVPDLLERDDDDASDEEPLPGPQRGKAGRPTGTTDEKRREDVKNFKDCISSIAFDFATEVTNRKAEKKRIAKGFLADLIKKKQIQFSVVTYISDETICSRVKRNNTNPNHPGTRSPIEEAEAALVVIAIQMGKIRQPLTCEEGIGLMNDLIKNTSLQDAVREFQMARRLCVQESTYGTVGKCWWKAFKRRNADKVVSKRGEKFACCRGEWTKKSNLAQMYDVIYDEMVDARIAIKLDVPVFTDRHGNEVDENNRFGLKQDIKITHPHYLIFADESGCNTNQKKDGQIGGRKHLVEKNTVPQTMACTNDHRFTVLPFTSASGEAICLVVIFRSEKDDIPLTWQTGIDPTQQPARDSNDEIDFELSTGEGKYFPGGPTCQYNGKTVDCLTYCSPSGGITGEILVKILTYFDEIDLWPRTEGGPLPMLVVDGHQSRLHPMFISYINDKGHEWRVCFGVPYATVLWQVGDASKQNGKFKIEWYRVKEDLMIWKFDNSQPRTLCPTDVMPLMNKIFHKSYNDVCANAKAVADRGWFPANRKLLEHTALLDDTIASPDNTTNVTEASNSTASTITLNIEDGKGAMLLDRIIGERVRSAAGKKAADTRKRHGDLISKNLQDAKRLSTGVMAADGIHSLNDPRFLQPLKKRAIQTKEKESRAAADKRGKLTKRIENATKLREKFGNERTHLFANFNLTQCAVYLQYKKQSHKDGKMPADLDKRRERCVKWITRTSPTASPHASDDEDKEGNAYPIASPHMSDDEHMGSPTEYPHDSDDDDYAGAGDDEVDRENERSARDDAAASLIGFASNAGDDEVDEENQHSARDDAAASLFKSAPNEC